MQYYRQCKLQKGNVTQTAWIPEVFANKNKYIKIKTDGRWENGWQVVEVYGRMSAKQLTERSQDYKHQREASDI